MLKRLCATMLFAGLMVGAVSLPALADPHKFKVINAGGHQVDHVYFSPISKATWGRDKLGTDVIGPGQYVVWTINTHCEMDVRVVYHNGNVIVKPDVDTCQYDLRLTY